MKKLVIANRTFTNRFFLGTGKFASRDQTRAALAASGTELVTVALTRVRETLSPSFDHSAQTSPSRSRASARATRRATTSSARSTARRSR